MIWFIVTYVLVTLLSAEAEVQYVALRNINLIVQKRYPIQIFAEVLQEWKKSFIVRNCSESTNLDERVKTLR